MNSDRRKFLKLAGLAGLGIAGAPDTYGSGVIAENIFPGSTVQNQFSMEENISIIGRYGPWASSRMENKPGEFSFRKEGWRDLDAWREAARQRVLTRMAVPEVGNVPNVKVEKSYRYDGLLIEELTWQLPFGPPTQAILLKPENHSGRLPGVLAFHDHGGNKYFGTRKITRTGPEQHPMMVDHQKQYYEGKAWANELAKRGYVVLVPDVFTFASRRVMMADVPPSLRNGLSDTDPEKEENIHAYNRWAGDHEHIMAKSLFSAGTTWPGVFFAEDRTALDILAARQDVDPQNLGCAGLSGGGLRTVITGGLDPRIKCAISVGFMTTWKDFVLNKSYTHTWMAYIPLLPNELDFPEIFGLRAPLPTMVLNDSEDTLYTLPEMKRADEILKTVFAKAGGVKNYRCSFYPGPHKFDLKMQKEAFDFFDQSLK